MPGRACPVCGGEEAALLFEQRFEQLSGARLLDGYDIVVCRDCGAAFADHIPEQAAFDEYYRELSKYEGNDEGNGTPPTLETRLVELAFLMRPFLQSADARILEIGCGYGQLLWMLRQHGFSNVTGADPSPGCARAARRFYDVPVIASTVFSVPEPDKPYDFLVLSGVMEHIRDLDRTAERFHSLLGPAGRVFLQVPDASRLEPGLDAPFQEFSTEHINYFSPVSLNNLMTQRGFRVVAGGRAVCSLHESSCRAAWGVYERSDARSPLEKDAETEAGLRAYIEGCRAEDAEMRARIQRALPPGGRMIVWGVGTHTLRLLATGGLDTRTIKAFVDSNIKYQNQELRGLPVISPEELRSHPEPILISSRGFQNQIHNQIRHRLGLTNPVILLYDSTVASV